MFQLNALSSITSWVILLISSMITSLVVYVISWRQMNPSVFLVEGGRTRYLPGLERPVSRSRLIAGIAGVLPWTLLFPGYLALLLSTRMQLSAHGYLHSGYIYQILNGRTPPENAVFPGYPGNYYWYYHGLVAALSKVFNNTPPLMGTILSMVAMATTLGLIYQILGYLLIQERRPLVLTALAFFSLFGMNLFGVVHSVMRFAPDGHSLQSVLLALIPQSLFGDPRLNVTLVKYLAGLDGTSMGWLMYVFVILVAIKALSGEASGKDIILSVLAVFTALALHPTGGIFIVVAVPAALLATYLILALLDGNFFNGSYHKQQLTVVWQIITQHRLWSLALVTILIVLGFATLGYLFGASSTTRFGIDIISLGHLKSLFSMTYPLIPFFLIGAYNGFRTADRKVIFLTGLTIIGMAMGYTLRLANNEYKFTFAGSIAMCILCTVPIWRNVFKPDAPRVLWRSALGLLMLVLMFVNVFVYGVSHLAQPWVKADNFVANGVHIDSRFAYSGVPYPEVDLHWARDDDGNPYPTDLQYADVFQWAREYTPKDAVLVVPMNYVDQSSLYILSERLPYVVNGETMNSLLPDYNQRLERIYSIFETADSIKSVSQALNEIRSDFPERTTYLLYPLSDSELNADPDKYGLTLVYKGRFARLFQIEGK